MFSGLAKLINAPVRAAFSQGKNQLSNFGNMLTGKTSPLDYVGNTAKNLGNYGYQSLGGGSSPFGDGSGNSMRRAVRQTGNLSMDQMNNQNMANQNQFQAQNQRQFDQNNNLANPFNTIQGSFSNMLTGQGNFAPGQREDLRYGNPRGKERTDGFLGNQGYAPQSWR